MESILIRIAQLLLSLSILVVIHELGHFLFAKLFRVRVEKFYLFFNPWFSLFKWKPEGSETEYGIGWLPLGGYVKISGMIDESMDKEAMKEPPKEYEFRSKPAWQRLLIMVGGVMMNFILAFIIYSAVVFYWGNSYIPIQETPLYFGEAAHNNGFKDGDIILAADNEELYRYDDLELFKIIDATKVTVFRDGEKKEIYLPDDFKTQILASKTTFADIAPAMADTVVPNHPAAKAGMIKGDLIVSINNQAVSSFSSVSSELKKYPNEKISMDVMRQDSLVTLSVLVDEEGKIGFSALTRDKFIHEDYSFFQSIPSGIQYGWRKLSFYVLQLKLIFTKEGMQSLGGFGAIGSMFPPTWDWYAFWTMTAFLSLILGVMNLLPIPALDGGHVLFLLWEVITRRKPNEKFMEYAQVAGMIFLFALLIYANGMDIIRAFFK